MTFSSINFNINELIVGIDISTKCQYNCSYCYARNERYKGHFGDKFFMSFDEFKFIIKCILKVKIPRYIRVDLYGGEPTLNPDINNMIDYLDSIDRVKEITIVSNGRKDLKFIHQSSKLVLMQSLHLSQCKNLNIFINNLKYFKNSYTEIMYEANYKDKILDVVNLIPGEKHLSYILNYDFNDKRNKVELPPKILDIEDAYDFVVDSKKCSLRYIYENNYLQKSFKNFSCAMNNIVVDIYGNILRCHFQPDNIFDNPDYFKNFKYIIKCPFDFCKYDSTLTCLKK
jgi:sulfatase maturation enzyme AslB (radical SAM superfamily)